MKVLISKEKIKIAQEQFATAIRSSGKETAIVSLGFQSGHFDTRVSWLEGFAFWAYFGFPPDEKSPGKRYWNVFGLGKPSSSVSISCEINPPIMSINRQAGGVFLEDPSGGIHVGHRGILNARGRIEKDFVFSNFQGKKLTVDDAGQRTSILYIGKLNDSSFLPSLRDFIRDVVRVKELARTKREG